MKKDLINNLFFIVLLISLIGLVIYHYIFLIMLIFYLAFLVFKIKNKNIIFISIIISILFILVFLLENINFEKYKEGGDIYKVIDIKKEDDKNILTLKKGKYRVYLYTKRDIEISSLIKVNDKISEIDDNRLISNFDYKKYLKNSLIIGIIKTDDVIVIKKTYSLYNLRYYLKEYINKNYSKDTSSMLKAFLIGEKDDFSDDFTENLRKNGIMHLFAISGLHVSLFILILKKILSFFKIKEKHIDIISIIFLSIYLFITSFLVSVLRASLMHILNIVNKKRFKGILQSLDIASIVFIALLLYRASYLFDLGFILSFLSTFSIILINNILKTKKAYIQIFAFSLCINIISLPVLININYKINILSPILNIIYITLFSYIVLPLSILCLLSSYFSPFLDLVYLVFRKITTLTSLFNLEIRFPHMNEYALFMYILVLILFICSKRKKIVIIIYLLFLVLYSNIAYLNVSKTIDFLYLNNGESSLIRYKEINILIDTGDGYKDEVLNFLYYKGIKKIDYLVISHNHEDHYGGVKNIYKNIKVKKIVVSKYNSSFYTYYKNVIKMDVFDEIKIKGINIKCIWPSEREDEENNNSLVLLVSFDEGRSILFTGDIQKEIEEDVINNLNKDYIDILKVAHHGSKTSTSEGFISKVHFKEAIIMNSYKWRNVFPEMKVVEILEKYKIKYYIISDFKFLKYDIRKSKYYYSLLG